MENILITQKEENMYLCHICGETLGSMDTLKRHLKCHDKTYNCPICKYTSPRRDTVKRYSLKHKRDQCRSSVTAYNSYQDQLKPTVLETKPYQSDPSQINSYLYKQTLPKNKAIFPWILHELDALPIISRPYKIKVIIPQEAEKQLPVPRLENTIKESTCSNISSEIDHILNQEFEISTSLSELDLMLRQLEAEDVPPPNYTKEEETKAWTVHDTFGTIAMDVF